MRAANSIPTKSDGARPSALFYVLLAAALLIFIQSFALLSPILLSLLLILLISLAVNPIIARMRAWTGSRKGATGLLALVVVGVIGLTGWAFIVPMKDSVTKLADQLPEYWERLQKPLIKLEQKAVSSEIKLQAEVTTEIAQEKAVGGGGAEPATAESAQPKPEPESGPVRSGLSQMFQGALGRFTAVAVNLAHILVVLVTVFFGVTFTLMNPRPIFRAMFSLVPARHHDQALTIMQRIGKFVPRWAGATLLGMVTIGLLVFLLMWPLFGFMDALVLGLIAGVLEAVPYLGPILSAVPALLLALGEGGDDSVVGRARLCRDSGLGEQCDHPSHHDTRVGPASLGGHSFHALVRGHLRRAGCAGGRARRGHREHPARRALSEAFSSHGH